MAGAGAGSGRATGTANGPGTGKVVVYRCIDAKCKRASRIAGVGVKLDAGPTAVTVPTQALRAGRYRIVATIDHEIVRQLARIPGFTPDQLLVQPRRAPCSRRARDEALGRRLLVTAGSVELSGGKQARQLLRFEVQGEFGGVHHVVLDGVGVALNHRWPEARQCPHPGPYTPLTLLTTFLL